MTGDIRIVAAGAERIDDLEPLWKAMHAHHAQVTPVRAGVPARPADQAWSLRRARYQELLESLNTFVLLAELDGRAVGYALANLVEARGSYATGDRVGELETLSVLPELRGRGIGTLLMDAVEDELRARGVAEIRLNVVAGNERAMRFYERRGMALFTHVLLGRVGEAREAQPVAALKEAGREVEYHRPD
jgi:ribosomal protein S18 acetylase RimI-like enzyme